MTNETFAQLVTLKERRTHVEKVYKLLSAKERWTKGTYARDYKGAAIHPASPSAKTYDLVGAFWRTRDYVPLTAHFFHREADYLCKHIPWGRMHLNLFNDDSRTTHEDVLALLREAYDSLTLQITLLMVS